MAKLPKDKITLSIYVTPRCREKLECLQKLYNIAGKDFSLSKVVEDGIHLFYAAAYLCRDSWFWKGFFKVAKVLESGEATKEGLDEVLSIVQAKKHAANEVLTVDIKFKDNLVADVKKLFKGKED